MMTLKTVLLLVLAGYAVIVNLTAFCLYAIDKKRAREARWRIKESTLIGVAFLGGGLGAYLGMKLLRHKTQHEEFLKKVPLGMVLGFLAAAGLIFLILFVL